MKARARASAPAKVILLGEHFVVYGKSATVLAVDKRATVTADIRDDKKIWIKSKDLQASGYFLRDQFYTDGGGGCMIALALPEKLGDVAEAIDRAGGEAFITRKTLDGVRIEE